jgi:hypothetical protein
MMTEMSSKVPRSLELVCMSKLRMSLPIAAAIVRPMTSPMAMRAPTLRPISVHTSRGCAPSAIRMAISLVRWVTNRRAEMTSVASKAVARPVFFLLAVLGCSRIVGAQDLRPYAGGAVEVSTWGVHSWSGSPSLTYNNTSEDTKVAVIAGEVGLFVGRNVAFGAEINIPFGRSTVTSGHGSFNPYTRLSRYRERSVFGVFHGYLPTDRRVRVGVLGGAGIVFASYLDRFSYCNFDSSIACTPFSPEQESTRTAFGATLGGDVVIQTARRVSLVSQFRLVWIDRGPDPSSAQGQDFSFVTLGLDRVAYRAGIGLRVDLFDR